MINLMSQTVRKMQQISVKIAIYGQFRWLKVTEVKSEVIAFLKMMWASNVLSFVASTQSIVPVCSTIPYYGVFFHLKVTKRQI